MKTRADLYSKEAASLLRDIAMYRVLTKEQLLSLYPGKRVKIKNLLTFMEKQGRIHFIKNYYCAAPECVEEIDRGLLAAIWVLADFIDQVEFHIAGDYPAKIIFFADGEIYEVVYAETGKEVLISNLLNAYSEEAAARYLVIVDDMEQIEQLQTPEGSIFCTVSPEGTVQYYSKE